MQIPLKMVFQGDKTQTLKFIAKTLCGISIAIGIFVLIGWQFNLEILKSGFPKLVPVNPLTAVLFILSGTSALMLNSEKKTKIIIAKIIAVIILVLASMEARTIFGYQDFPTDKILFHDQIMATDPTNQVAPMTALNFVIIGLALLAIDFKGELIKNPNHFLIIMSLFLVMLSLLGYLYGVIYLYEISNARFYPIALYSAINFLILDLGILLMRPGDGFVKLAFNSGPSGITIRRLIPTILFITIMIGWVRFYLQQAGILNYELLVTLTATLFFFITAIIIWWNSRSLFLIDEERKNAGNQLLRQEDLFQSMISSMGEAIIAVDTDFTILAANKVAAKLSGMKQQEMIGKDVRKYLSFVKNGKSFEIAAKMDLVGTVIDNVIVIDIRDDLYLKNAKGKIFPVSGVIAPLKNGDSVKGLVAAFSDISQDKEIDIAKTEFVSLASHQLRTPLSTINWYTEMLQSGDAGPTNPAQAEYLDEIMHANKRMIDLVNSLLNVSQLELGVFSDNPQVVDPGKIAHIVVEELTARIAEKKLKIEEIYDKNVPIILANPNYIKIIFQNLIVNAIKYSSNEGNTVKIEISKNKNKLLFKVTDTGYGIPESAKSKVFLKLFRADNVKATNAEGIGLGLYLVKLIVDKLGGKIWFESEENKETTFYVSLPYKLASGKNISNNLSTLMP